MGKWRGGGGCVQLRKAGLPPRCKHLAISHRRLPLAWVDAGTGTLPQAFPAIPKDNEPEFSNRDMLGKGPGRMGRTRIFPAHPAEAERGEQLPQLQETFPETGGHGLPHPEEGGPGHGRT